jgi:hypothetical protein
MLHANDTFSLDEIEDPSDLLRALPEIRQNLQPMARDDELGLRTLLEWPGALWRRPSNAA